MGLNTRPNTESTKDPRALWCQDAPAEPKRGDSRNDPPLMFPKHDLECHAAQYQAETVELNLGHQPGGSIACTEGEN